MGHQDQDNSAKNAGEKKSIYEIQFVLNQKTQKQNTYCEYSY
jgi:hypothetical protein